MPQAARLRDLCTGHGCYPPRPNKEGSPNVFINGRPSHRWGDSWHRHCCGDSCHGGVTIKGSPNVFVNGRPKARVGDDIQCSNSPVNNIMTGSHNVFVNG